MSVETTETPLRLHTRRLSPEGTPDLTAPFLRCLDRRTPSGLPRLGTPAVPLSLDEGRARLVQEYPPLSACIETRGTTRAVATALGVSPATVCNRRRSGVAHLVIWTNLSEQDVADGLGYGMDRRHFVGKASVR